MLVLAVVEPAGQAVQSGRGTVELPPADQVPTPHSVHLGPPVPATQGVVAFVVPLVAVPFVVPVVVPFAVPFDGGGGGLMDLQLGYTPM